MKAFAIAVFLAGLALGVAYPEIAGRGTLLGSYSLRENQWVWSTSVQLDPGMNPLGLSLSGTLDYGGSKIWRSNDYRFSVLKGRSTVAEQRVSLQVGDNEKPGMVSGSISLDNLSVAEAGRYDIRVVAPGSSLRTASLELRIWRNMRPINERIRNFGLVLLVAGLVLMAWLGVIPKKEEP